MSTKTDATQVEILDPIKIFVLPVQLDSEGIKETAYNIRTRVSPLYPDYDIISATPSHNTVSPNGQVLSVNVLIVMALRRK